MLDCKNSALWGIRQQLCNLHLPTSKLHSMMLCSAADQQTLHAELLDLSCHRSRSTEDNGVLLLILICCSKGGAMSLLDPRQAWQAWYRCMSAAACVKVAPRPQTRGHGTA